MLEAFVAFVNCIINKRKQTEYKKNREAGVIVIVFKKTLNSN